MAEFLLALGDFRFSVDTAAYQTLERSNAYNWPEQALVGRAPALQFSGVGAETITLPGIIYPAYKGGLGQMDDLRVEALRGEPLDLVDGEGNYWGKYVITGISETRSYLTKGGSPLKIEFTINLKKYGD